MNTSKQKSAEVIALTRKDLMNSIFAASFTINIVAIAAYLSVAIYG